MNEGIVARRYARTLLAFTKEKGSGERVFAQVRALLKDPSSVPAALENDLEAFLLLLRRNGRMELLKFVLWSFVDLYCQENGIVRASLKTAVKNPDIEDQVRKLLAPTARTVELTSETDPALIGGFVLTIEDNMLDGSVKAQLDAIRRQLDEKNKRIV